MPGQGVTNMWANERFNMPGMAIVERFDTLLDAYRYLGLVRDVSLSTEEEHRQQYGRVKGKRKVTQQRNVMTRMMLRYTLAERMYPEAARIIMGVTAEQQSLVAVDMVLDKIMRHLYNDDVVYTTNEYGLPLQTRCPLPVISSAAGAGSSGSGWTTGNNYFQIAPGWFRTGISSISTWANKVDLDYTHGRFSEVVTVNIAGATETVTINTAAYTHGNMPTPDFWLVRHSTNADMSSSNVRFSAYGGAQALAQAGPPNDPYAQAYNIGVESVADYDTGTPSYTKMVPGTDVTINTNQATVKRIAGGAVAHGEEVRLSVWNIFGSYVETEGRADVSPTNISKLRLTAIEESRDIDDVRVFSGTGEVYELYEVDMSSGSREMGWTEDDFAAGTPIDHEVLYSDSEDSFYKHKSVSPDHVNWVQQYA